MSGVLDPVQAALLRDLRDPDARDPASSGSKAASLATAHGNGLPVVPGFVITTHVHALFVARGHLLSGESTGRLHEAWARLTRDGQLPVIVRSSSTVEDVGASSMAGRFRTVLDVRGWEAFLDAVSAVFASADEVSGNSDASPMGILVQRHVSPSRAGVMFGIDPVSGDASRIVVEAVSGGPDKLVSGRVTAQHYVLARSGRLVTLDHHPARRLRPHHDQRRILDTADLLALARLARRTQRVFGVAQDMEWAFGPDGSLVLLQSRPVTATGVVAPAGGPVLGPGPLAETFPDPLGELEVDLWIRPLRDAVVDAMTETRSVSRRRLATSPAVTLVGGRVAADLELFGYVHSRSALGVFDPRPAARQLAVAWRVGVLRAELPARAAALVSEVDASLMAIDPGTTSDGGLLDLLEHGSELLRRLHHAEVLAGTLLPSPSTTAAAIALQILPDLPDLPEAELIRRHPILLCLVPPSLTDEPALPPAPTTNRKAPVGQLGPREQLRLRVRWTQEMTVRVVRELAQRLALQGRLGDAGSVGMLHLHELRELVSSEQPVEGIHERRAAELSAAFGPPLPAQFRLTADGAVVPVSRPGARPSSSGLAAGGGRGVGPVCHGSVRHSPSPGDVLVVRDLQPGLAAWLPGLAGLVAETGGTLSHLAILAREYGVPTVVAVPDALHRYQPGTRLLVDGTTGELRVVDRGQEP